MSIYQYFQKKDESECLPTSPPCGSSLKQKEIDKANHLVKKAIEKDLFTKRGKYATYTATERAKIGKYAAENGNTKACGYFFKAWKREIPESTVRCLKNEYLKELNEKRMAGYDEKECTVTCLPTQSRGRPLLVGVELDVAIQDYIRTLRQAGGVVNTAIVMAAAEGIISSRCPGKLQKQGGDIQIGKDWAKSLMSRMGFVKRKVSNAGKILSSAIFLELREQFLADIAAEVIMNDIHPDLIINWDQTGLKFVPTGDWTMNLSGDKVVSIVGSDDKREITAVLAVTITGRCLPPQLLYKGTTSKCHPIIEFPERWDIWHSHNHWSNEETMKRYLDKILLPFIDEQRKSLLLDSTHKALVIFDGFKGQNTTEFLNILEKHNISWVRVPPNCTDKLQPLDVSINKPMKTEMRKQFQSYYASEVQKQISSNIPFDEIKVDLSTATLKTKGGSWIISSWHEIEKKPEMAINGFKKAGIFDIVYSS